MFGENGDNEAGSHLAKNNDNFNLLEELDFPTCIAINGYAMGGGLELALACDFRIMSSKAKIGLPETKLGIIPGWGGTVRLPRIAGADTAIDWICSGKEQRPDVALKAGVVDGVVEPEHLRDAALSVLQDAIDGKMDYDAREQEGFQKMAATSVAESLVGLFLSDQLIGKKAKSWEKKADRKVERAAVLGAGIMGGGIAYQSAYKGTPIKMKDINQDGLDLGLSEANKLLAKRVNRGRMTVEEMGKVLANIDPTLAYDNFDGVDKIFVKMQFWPLTHLLFQSTF